MGRTQGTWEVKRNGAVVKVGEDNVSKTADAQGPEFDGVVPVVWPPSQAKNKLSTGMWTWYLLRTRKCLRLTW